MRNTLAAAFLALLTAAPAAAGSLAMVASTARVDYYAEKGQRVDVKRTESFLDDLEKQFGRELTGRSRFVRHRDAEQLVKATGLYAAGVTLPREQVVHSTFAFHPHELVHLVASDIGDPGVVFQEGLAVVLGDEGKYEGRHARNVTAEEAARYTYQSLADRFRLGGAGPDEYLLAAAFVAFLDETAGRAAVIRLFADCRTPAKAPAVFAQTFGASIEVKWREFQQSRPRRRIPQRPDVRRASLD